MLTKSQNAPVQDFLQHKDTHEEFVTIEGLINIPPNTAEVSKNTTKNFINSRRKNNV